MEVNKRFAINNDYSSLPINVRAQSFTRSNNCKQFMVMNTVVFLSTDEGPAKENNWFVNRYMLLCK